MSVNWQQVGAKAQKAAQTHEDRKSHLVVEIGNALGRVFDNDPSDSRLEAVCVILGTKPGGRDKAAELLGLSVSAPAQQSGPLALTADPNADKGYGPDVLIRGDKVYLPEVDHDGVKINGSAQLESVVNNVNGYELVVKNGLIYGFSRGGAPAPQPSPTQPGDQEVDRLDKKGAKIGTVKVKDGRDNPQLEAILGNNNEVIAFREKSRFRNTKR